MSYRLVPPLLFSGLLMTHLLLAMLQCLWIKDWTTDVIMLHFDCLKTFCSLLLLGKNQRNKRRYCKTARGEKQNAPSLPELWKEPKVVEAGSAGEVDDPGEPVPLDVVQRHVLWWSTSLLVPVTFSAA